MNNDTLKILPELLDKERIYLLANLIPIARDFTLGGGTALSLQIKHRKSFDFDFFSEKEIPKNLPKKVALRTKISQVSVNTADEFTFFDSHDIKTTFLYYPFKRFYKPVKLENGLCIYSTKEIAVQKSYTLGRRGEYRDYFDLYSLLKQDCISLQEIISSAQKIYGSLFNPKIFLEQLTYFGDILNFELIPVSRQKLPKPEEVKKFLEKTVIGYLSKEKMV